MILKWKKNDPSLNHLSVKCLRSSPFCRVSELLPLMELLYVRKEEETAKELLQLCFSPDPISSLTVNSVKSLCSWTPSPDVTVRKKEERWITSCRTELTHSVKPLINILSLSLNCKRRINETQPQPFGLTRFPSLLFSLTVSLLGSSLFTLSVNEITPSPLPIYSL